MNAGTTPDAIYVLVIIRGIVDQIYQYFDEDEAIQKVKELYKDLTGLEDITDEDVRTGFIGYDDMGHTNIQFVPMR